MNTDQILMATIIAVVFGFNWRLESINSRLKKLEGKQPAQQSPREP